MKLFAFHSPAVAPLWRLFSASVPKGFDLCPIEVPGEFDGVLWEEARYWRLMKWIVGERVARVRQNQGQIIATSGCDSVFFGDCVPDLLARIERFDYLASSDCAIAIDDDPARLISSVPVRLCSCLQVVRCNAVNLALQQQIYDRAGRGSDDSILNALRDTVRWRALPRPLYWNISTPGWKAGDYVPAPPTEMRWFHANWAMGTEHKLALITEVLRKRSAQ